MMIPSWLLIGVVGFLVALAGGLLNSRDVRWFARLRRPDWLTFEGSVGGIDYYCLYSRHL